MLRVGVMLNGMRAPAWGSWLLNAIRGHADLEVTLAVIANRTDEGRPSTLFAAYEALDRRVFSNPPDALEQVDLSPALERVPRLHLPAIPGERDSREHGEGDRGAHEPPLDVLVCLGPAASAREIP